MNHQCPDCLGYLVKRGANRVCLDCGYEVEIANPEPNQARDSTSREPITTQDPGKVWMESLDRTSKPKEQ